MANEFVLRKGLISLGGVTFPLTQVNGAYTVLPTDYFVEATGNSFTINLPSASGITGQSYEIKNSGGVIAQTARIFPILIFQKYATAGKMLIAAKLDWKLGFPKVPIIPLVLVAQSKKSKPNRCNTE